MIDEEEINSELKKLEVEEKNIIQDLKKIQLEANSKFKNEKTMIGINSFGISYPASNFQF